MSEALTTFEATDANSPIDESPSPFDWRFDLKTLFLCVIAFAIPCRWVAVSSEQRWCVSELESIGAYCRYEYEWEDLHYFDRPIVFRPRNVGGEYDGHSLASAIGDDPHPFEGFWLFDLGTRDMLHRVKGVNIKQRFPTARTIQLIARIGTVEEICIQCATLDRNVVDAFEALHTLRKLTIDSDCMFRTSSLAELQERLPNCKIYRYPPRK